MNKTYQSKILFILCIAFSVFWMAVVGLDYVNKHPIYAYAVKFFRFQGLTIGLMATGILIYVLQKSKYALNYKIPVNGLILFFFGAIVSYFIIKSNASLVGFKTDSSDYMHYVSLVIKSAFQVLLLGGILTSFGKRISDFFYKRGIRENRLLDLAFGIIGLVLIMFVLSASQLLTAGSLLIVFAVLALLNIKNLLPVFKKIFTTRIDVYKYNVLGFASLYLIFLFLLINFVSIQNPYPSGFDSRNYYTNLSMLLSQNNGLISGYAPYNWSFVMAVGLILFDQIELCLSISFSAFVLVMLSSYQIATRNLKLDANKTLFVLGVLCVIPALVNQMFVELKVDFGMLYIQLLCLFYLFELLPGLVSNLSEDTKIKRTLQSTYPGLALIGILCGFGLGIKMINMFLVFAILVILWWADNKNKLAIVMILLFTIAVFLFAGIDEMSGLRKYHLNTGTLKIALIVSFLGCLVYSLIKYRTETIKKIIFSALFLGFMSLSLSPWVVKNIVETRSVNPKTIMLGGNIGPKFNKSTIIHNYKKSQKNDQ